MESRGERFSVISKTSDSETENRTPSTPCQPISVIKKSLKSWDKSVRRSKHPKHIIVLEGEPVTYKCTVCSTTFKSKSNCCYHKHCGDEGEKPFACSICDRKFSTKTHFSYHILMHSGLNPHKCSACGKSFKTKYKLRRHQQVHTDTQKKFFCDVCGRAFLRKSSIHVHKQVHTGVKPYQCNECPKAFREKKNLIFHLSHHTGIKNWVCEICGRSYVLKRDLELHKRTHSRIRPFTCTVGKCLLTFSQRRYLKRHMETHKSCVKFICNLCEKEFSRKDNLQRHIVNTHLESQNSNLPKAEKAKHILLDTAPYIKTIKIQDVAESSNEVIPVERQIPAVRTESVIMSASRTDDGVISVHSNREEHLCNRISVIKTLAEVSSEAVDENNLRELNSNDPEEYKHVHQPQLEPGDLIGVSSNEETSLYANQSAAMREYRVNERRLEIGENQPMHTFHSYLNCDRDCNNTHLSDLADEPVGSNANTGGDTMRFDSYPHFRDGEQLHNQETDSWFRSRYNVPNEVSFHYTDLERRETVSAFRDESEGYVPNSTHLKSFEFSNRSTVQFAPHENIVHASQDQRFISYYDRERLEDITAERRTSVYEVTNNNEWVTHEGDRFENCIEPKNQRWMVDYEYRSFEKNSSVREVDRKIREENKESFVFRHVFDSLDPLFAEATPRVVHNFESSGEQPSKSNRRSVNEPEAIYHDLTNCLSVDLNSSSRSDNREYVRSNGNTNALQSSTNYDRVGENGANAAVASHFVPHFAPERIAPEIVKTRCMLPKKVIAASYRNCVAHEIINTRAGGLDTTTKDSYKLLDLSMKSQ